MKVYEITQAGKILSCQEKIILGNKLDNIVTQLHFAFDEEIEYMDGVKYVALLNPATEKYRIIPMSDDSVLIGENITAYPGKWQILVIVTKTNEDKSFKESVDYDIYENLLKESVWVSNVLKCIVRDNFLTRLDNIDDSVDPNISIWFEKANALSNELQKYISYIDIEYKQAVDNGYDGSKDDWIREHFELSQTDVIEF